MKNMYQLSSILLTVTALSACGTPPQNNAQMDAINSDYSNAQGNPNVTRFAPIELQQASQAVDNAALAQRQQDDREIVDHLMYVAKQRIEIAEQTAKLKAAELAIADIGANRENIRLGLRTAEADASKQKLLNAQRQADQQDTELEASQTQLEMERARLVAQSQDTDAANAQIIAMEAQLKALNAKQTERGMVITLGDVLFDTSKADLKDNSIASVEKLAGFFKQYRGRTALIEGYTDSRGEEVFNQALSEQRAAAVRDALIGMGIEPSRVSTRGFGEANPVASNNTAVGRQLNRRVEIIVSGDSADNEAQ